MLNSTILHYVVGEFIATAFAFLSWLGLKFYGAYIITPNFEQIRLDGQIM